ncbi:MAG: asparagine synthase-related protein [Terriglobales bacterium]
MPRSWAEPQLLQMLKVLRHESFYETGTWIDEQSGVYVGWTARENSFSAGMPLRNERGEVVLVFAGEEYSDPAKVRQLRERGHEIAAEGASYLVHVYEEDPSFPKCLNGRFQGLLADKVRGITTLFNDRYGMHRLYYHESRAAFYFAVEAKAILEVRPELRRADPRGLGEFVACGCVLENRTLFEGIHVLPPGSAWTFRGGSVESKSAYFEPREWERQEALDPELYHRNLTDAFSRNLPRYLNGKERIGVSLTGGLDTRAVMAWQRFSPGSLPCYTYGEAGRECRDVVVARRIARECQQSHQVIAIGSDFLERFPHYAERGMYLTDACVDVTRAPDLYFSERAREIAPVRMTGLYGDEVLRPHRRAFKPVDPAPEAFSSSFLPQVRAARDTYNEVIKCHPTSFSAFRQAPWHHFGILSLEQTQVAVRTPFLDNDFLQIVFRAPESATANNDLRVRLIGDGSMGLQRIRTDRGFGGNSGIGSWVAQNFQEFTFKAEYAYDYGMPQWLARLDHFFSPLKFERLFLGRHKVYHYRVWYRDILANYVQEMLLDSRTLARPYLERKGVEAIVRGHLKGGCNYTTEIHRLLSLELLHRLFLDARN